LIAITAWSTWNYYCGKIGKEVETIPTMHDPMAA
jgi:hypothetical protein